MKKAILVLAIFIVAFGGCGTNGDADYEPGGEAEVLEPVPEQAPITEAPEPEYEPLPEGAFPPIVISEGAMTPDFNIITAAEWVSNVRMGWNLGNTLDTYSATGRGFSWLGGGLYVLTSILEMETAWGNPHTTREMIETISDAGFNAIRIPTTWHKAADDNFIIREDWMERVTEIVDFAMDAGMQVILNTHHDNRIFRLHDEYIEDSKIALERIWTQIAYAFRDYDERLIFNGLNEPRTQGTPAEWRGGTQEERENLNRLHQVFVDAVRNTGGNNAERVLLIPTYAASTARVAQYAMEIPIDSVEDRIIVALHMYSPWEFALRTGAEALTTTWDAEDHGDTSPITDPIFMAYELFVSNGIPVVMGEMGALNRGNEEYRAKWAYFYVSFARSLGIPCFWWDNGEYWPSRENAWGWDETFGLLIRRTNEFAHPLIIDALMRATE